MNEEVKNCVVLTDSVVVILLFIGIQFFFAPPSSNLGGHIERLKILVFVLNRRKL